MGTISINPTPEYAIFELVTGYAKIYPDSTKLFEFKQPIKVRIAGYEPMKPKQTQKSPFVDPLSLIDSLRRTKTRLSDIVISNKFDLFCTFTFKEDRQNIPKLKKQMSTWLNHQQKRTGKFDYLIVPEFHKDGKSIHFHALFAGYKGNLVDSGHKRKDGRVVYNISGYKLGFSTATKIDNEGIPLVASYIKKYITKDMPQFNGKKRYWCSHNLERPTKITNPILFPSQLKQFSEPHEMKNNMTVRIAPKKIIPIQAPHYIAANGQKRSMNYLKD